MRTSSFSPRSSSSAHRHVRHEVRRDALLDVGADQEPVTTDEDVPALQQVAVEHVEGLGRRVPAAVVVVERAGRDRAGVEREVREVRELLEHQVPRGEAVGEGHPLHVLGDGVGHRRRPVRHARFGAGAVGVGGGVAVGGDVRDHRGPLGRGRVEVPAVAELLTPDHLPAPAAVAPVAAAAAVQLVGRLGAELRLVLLPLVVGHHRQGGLVQLLAELRVAELLPVAALADLLNQFRRGRPSSSPAARPTGRGPSPCRRRRPARGCRGTAGGPGRTAPAGPR